MDHLIRRAEDSPRGAVGSLHQPRTVIGTGPVAPHTYGMPSFVRANCTARRAASDPQPLATEHSLKTRGLGCPRTRLGERGHRRRNRGPQPATKLAEASNTAAQTSQRRIHHPHARTQARPHHGAIPPRRRHSPARYAIAACRIRSASSRFCSWVVVNWRCIAASLSSIAETNSFTPAGEPVAGAIAAAWACADPAPRSPPPGRLAPRPGLPRPHDWPGRPHPAWLATATDSGHRPDQHPWPCRCAPVALVATRHIGGHPTGPIGPDTTPDHYREHGRPGQHRPPPIRSSHQR